MKIRNCSLLFLFFIFFMLGCEKGGGGDQSNSGGMGGDAGQGNALGTGNDGGDEPPPPMPVCGNGVLESAEQCDDSNLVPGDGCDAFCNFECGNGRVDENEQCDDSNRIDNDGCSAACLVETLRLTVGEETGGRIAPGGFLKVAFSVEEKSDVDILHVPVPMGEAGGEIEQFCPPGLSIEVFPLLDDVVQEDESLEFSAQEELEGVCQKWSRENVEPGEYLIRVTGEDAMLVIDMFVLNMQTTRVIPLGGECDEEGLLGRCETPSRCWQIEDEDAPADEEPQRVCAFDPCFLNPQEDDHCHAVNQGSQQWFNRETTSENPQSFYFPIRVADRYELRGAPSNCGGALGGRIQYQIERIEIPNFEGGILKRTNLGTFPQILNEEGPVCPAITAAEGFLNERNTDLSDKEIWYQIRYFPAAESEEAENFSLRLVLSRWFRQASRQFGKLSFDEKAAFVFEMTEADVTNFHRNRDFEDNLADRAKAFFKVNCNEGGNPVRDVDGNVKMTLFSIDNLSSLFEQTIWLSPTKDKTCNHFYLDGLRAGLYALEVKHDAADEDELFDFTVEFDKPICGDPNVNLGEQCSNPDEARCDSECTLNGREVRAGNASYFDAVSGRAGEIGQDQSAYSDYFNWTTYGPLTKLRVTLSNCGNNNCGQIFWKDLGGALERNIASDARGEISSSAKWSEFSLNAAETPTKIQIRAEERKTMTNYRLDIQSYTDLGFGNDLPLGGVLDSLIQGEVSGFYNTYETHDYNAYRFRVAGGRTTRAAIAIRADGQNCGQSGLQVSSLEKIRVDVENKFVVEEVLESHIKTGASQNTTNCGGWDRRLNEGLYEFRVWRNPSRENRHIEPTPYVIEYSFE